MLWQLDRALSVLYLLATPMTSLKMSLRNILDEVYRHTRKINLSLAHTVDGRADVKPFEILTFKKADSERIPDFIAAEELALYSLDLIF